jgi:hypothetical protein
MREAGAPSTVGVVTVTRRCARHPGGSQGLTPEVPRNAGRKAKDRLLRGGLALDTLHLLPRDVDRAGELVGLEHPAFHHFLNRRRS